MRLILAIILAGIGLYAQSPAQRQVSVFGTQPAWTPAQLGTSLALWLDAADSSTITLNGSTVSQWADKSGNGNNMAQSTAENQPTFVALSSLGKPVIGSELNTGTIGLTSVKSFSARQIYAVVRYGNGVVSLFTGGNVYPTLYSGPGANGAERAVMGTTAASTLFSTLTWDGGTAQKNGNTSSATVLPMPWSVLVTTGASTVDQFWTIGCNILASGRTWNGYYGEFVFLNAAADVATQRKIEGYLAWKWGIQSSLVADHPYKSRRPTR